MENTDTFNSETPSEEPTSVPCEGSISPAPPPLIQFGASSTAVGSYQFPSFGISMFEQLSKAWPRESIKEVEEEDSYPSRDDTSDDDSEGELDDLVVPTVTNGTSTSPKNNATRIEKSAVGGASLQLPTSVRSPSPSVSPVERANAVPREPFPSTKLGDLQSHLSYVKHGGTTQSTSQTALKERQQMYINTPIFTSAVSALADLDLPTDTQSLPLMPQYGLIGIKQHVSDADRDSYSTLSTHHHNGTHIIQPGQHESEEEKLVYSNINVPWSAFICGSQGAGKSHTLSCLLESSLVAGNDAGKLPNPLTGMVLHYDNYTSAASTQLCEAAYLCSSGIPVTILVSPANIWAMKRLYSELPGLPVDAPKPKVMPLYLAESQLDIARILKLMAIDSSADSVPLYMEVVTSILRDMAMEGANKGAFSYTEFRRRLAETTWVQGQMVPLNMRLQLLESFLRPSALTKTTRPAAAEEDIWDFKPGTLTIVDLSDPFVSSNDACSLFSICVSIFLEGRASCGRVVALDEAHKFLLQSGEALALTQSLTSIIRQQRHTGTRVMIATQEPTLAPELIDLANVTFVHRFSSPAWYDVLSKHLAGAKKQDSVDKNSLFETIVTLQTGEALLFSPTALTTVERDHDGTKLAKPLGNGYIKVNIRNRLTVDGGKSIMASSTAQTSTAQTSIDVPMHVVAAQVPATRPSYVAPPRPRPAAYHTPATSTHKVQEASTTHASNQKIAVADRIEQEMVRLVRERFRHGQHSYGILKKGDKDGIYSKVEHACQLKPGTIVNASDKSRWIALHQRTIAACQAQSKAQSKQ